jgi:hypothetical protein
MTQAIDLKLKVARAQLATALDLFIRDKDPISVQCLACGGGELLDAIALMKGAEPLSNHILQEHPHLDRGKLRGIRTQYWNAFKHLKGREGLLREDEALISNFDDTKNDTALYVGWDDYLKLSGALPVAAQVFQAWWCALYEDKLGDAAGVEAARRRFPELRSEDRKEQKRRLRRGVEKWRKDASLIGDDRTEKRLHERD